MAATTTSNLNDSIEEDNSDVDFQDAVDEGITDSPCLSSNVNGKKVSSNKFQHQSDEGKEREGEGEGEEVVAVADDAKNNKSSKKTKKQNKGSKGLIQVDNKSIEVTDQSVASNSTASVEASTNSIPPIESEEDLISTPQPQKESTEYNFTSTSASSHDDGTSAWENERSLSPHSSVIENTNGIKREGKQSIAGAVWRNSLHGGSGAGGVLEEITLKDEERIDKRRNTVTASSSSRNSKTGESGSEEGEIEDEEDSYQFLLQRLDAQNTALQTDPKARQTSAQSSTNIRANFERLKRESEEDASLIDWAFWGAAINNYEEVATNQPRELSRAIQQGIPSALRGMTWQLMSASKDLDLENTYSALLKQTSPHEKNIRRDLSRTYPKHEYFKESGGAGQENLFNVVKAYSLYDPDVGYTQGIQFIVGPLLLNMPDEEAFSVLVRLMKSYDLRSHYAPDMPGLQLRLFQFDRLLEELLPGLFMHLIRQGIKSSMYASQWLLTLFGYRFPMELITSVFDLIFAEGVEAIFRFSVAILKRNEELLCSLEFEKLIEFLRDGLFATYEPENAEDGSLYKAQEFVRDALQIKITPHMLDQFGEEWETICRTENAQTLEIETLKQANAHLTHQVKTLESTLSQINLEHCDLVKQVVMSKIEREELEDELVKYKIAFADMAHQQASEGASLRHSQGNNRDWEKK